MNNKIRMAVIGLGIGAAHGKRIIDDKDADLIAVCELNETRVKDVFESYKKDCNITDKELPLHYTDSKAMFENENLDAVIVSLPSGLHHQASVMAAEYGVNVLSDKPLEITTEKCDLVINACKKANVRLGVIYPFHFETLLAGMKKAIDDKLIGDLLMVDINLKWFRDQEYYDAGGWRGSWNMDGGGSLMNQGAHPVDYLCWLCGEPDEVTGDYGPLNHKIETEDWAMGIIRFKNGVRGSILTTTNVLPDLTMIRIEIHGTKGSMMIEKKTIDGQDQPPINVSTVENLETLGQRDFDYPVEQFIYALKNNKPFEVDGGQARNSVAIIEGIYRSANEGKRVKL